MRFIYPSLVLAIIVAACAGDDTDADADSSEWLLDIAKNTCAATRQALESYLEVRDINEEINESNSEAARKEDPTLDSAFAFLDSISEAWPDVFLKNEREHIVRLAAENNPPLWVRVSRQGLAAGPVASVGWIDFYYGPVVQDDRELYFWLTIFLVESNERGWGGDLAHYYENWITDGEASGDLIDAIHSYGRGCEIRSIDNL